MIEPTADSLMIDGRSLALSDIKPVARRYHRVILDPAAEPRIKASREAVERIAAAGVPTYGVNTGLGALSTRAINAADLRTLQHNLLRSHAAGTGPPLDVDVVRTVMLIRANSLAHGKSGARTIVVQRLLDLLNAGVTPAIPSQGSLGASGDLAPLAHLGLVLTGEGRVMDFDGAIVDAASTLDRAGIEPLMLEPKEALALINGTAVMAGIASLALLDAIQLLRSAILVGAMSAFAIAARREPFDRRMHEARPHPGQTRVAAIIGSLLGPLSDDHRATSRVQDPYSVRCIPPVLGAALDALQPLEAALEIEINSATDNPLVFAESDEALSGGNFHGHPLALPIGYAKVAIASVGNITERRIALLMDGEEYGLPAFLVANPGVNSGYMIAHYLTSGLVAENKILAHPSAVDSIPTSANIEDFNSMGTTGARHLEEIIRNVERIVAVEALCAAQACDLRSIYPGGVLAGGYETVRAMVPPLDADERIIADDIETIAQLVRTGRFARLIEEEIEKL
ncbi:MAG: histidine ammonia-lyase [Thermomicrobiales bacterium]